MALKQFVCLRCGYKWWPRLFDATGKPVRPDRCPPRKGCGSPYWDQPRLTAAQKADLVAKKTRAYWRKQKTQAK